MSGKKKADVEETEEEGETAFSTEVLEVVELYKQVAEASADATLVPTSEDVRAMALTVFIEKHRNERMSTGYQSPRTSAPSNSGADSGDALEKRACMGPSCGGQTLVGKMGSNGPFWFCQKCQGFTNMNKKGETYFKASTRPR